MRRLARRLSFYLMLAGGLMMCLMMVHITADVFLKYVFNQPIFGTVETVSYYYMIGTIYLPLAYVQVRGQHISVELFVERMPPPARRLAEGFGLLCAMLFFSILAYQAWLDAAKAFQIGEMIMGSSTLPIWPSRFLLPVSFTLVVIVSALRLVDEVVLGGSPPVSSAIVD